MGRMTPFSLGTGQVLGVVEDGREDLAFFGHYWARRTELKRFWRAGDGEWQEIVATEYLDVLRDAMGQHFQDERLHCERTGAKPRRWRLCLSPRLASQLAYTSFMSLKLTTQADIDMIRFGPSEREVEWVRFSVQFNPNGYDEVEISPAHFGFLLVPID